MELVGTRLRGCKRQGRFPGSHRSSAVDIRIQSPLPETSTVKQAPTVRESSAAETESVGKARARLYSRRTITLNIAPVEPSQSMEKNRRWVRRRGMRAQTAERATAPMGAGRKAVELEPADTRVMLATKSVFADPKRSMKSDFARCMEFCSPPDSKDSSKVSRQLCFKRDPELERYLDVSALRPLPYPESRLESPQDGKSSSFATGSAYAERFRRAAEHIVAGRCKEAAELLRPAFGRSDPEPRLACNYAIALHQLALSEGRRGSQESYWILSKLSSVHPKNVRFLYNKAVIECQSRMFSQCLATTKTLVALCESRVELQRKISIPDVARARAISYAALDEAQSASDLYHVVCQNEGPDIMSAMLCPNLHLRLRPQTAANLPQFDRCASPTPDLDLEVESPQFRQRRRESVDSMMATVISPRSRAILARVDPVPIPSTKAARKRFASALKREEALVAADVPLRVSMPKRLTLKEARALKHLSLKLAMKYGFGLGQVYSDEQKAEGVDNTRMQQAAARNGKPFPWR